MFTQRELFKGYRLFLISLAPLFFSACVAGPSPVNQTYLPPASAPAPAVPVPQNEPYQPPPQYSPPQYSPPQSQPQSNDGFAPPPPGYNPNQPQNYSVREQNETQQYSGTAAVIDRYEEPETITVAMLPNESNNSVSSYGQTPYRDDSVRTDEALNQPEIVLSSSTNSTIAPPSVSPFGSSSSASSAPPPPPRPSLNKNLLDTNEASSPVKALISGAKRDMSAGNAREAFAKLERALRIEPENSWVWHNMAKVNLSRGKYEQAITMAKKSNAYAIDTPDLQRQNWRLIGYASEQKGDVRGMQEAYQNEQLVR